MNDPQFPQFPVQPTKEQIKEAFKKELERVEKMPDVKYLYNMLEALRMTKEQLVFQRNELNNRIKMTNIEYNKLASIYNKFVRSERKK